MSTEVIEHRPLSVIERAAKALSKEETETEIKALVEQSKPIVAVTDAASRTVCHKSLMTLANLRIAIEKRCKKGRDEAVQYSKAAIAIEKDLVSLISPEEERLAAMRDEWDTAKEREREAKVAAEVARVEAIQRKISDIRSWPVSAATQDSMLVGQMLAKADAYVIDPAVFEELAQSATDALTVSRAALTHLLAQRQAHEAEAERVRLGMIELAQLKAEAAERAKADAAAQAIKDAEAKTERARLEADAQAKRDAEAAKQAEENRIEREAQEANRQRNEMALQEIQAIHHQVIIADTGRAPYCKGGDLHTYDWLLEQTEKWPITEETFGALFKAAESTKASTLASLRQKRAELVKRLEREAADKIERQRIADEAAETARDAKARQAELDAQAEAQRVAQATIDAQQAAIAEANKPKPQKRKTKAPTEQEILTVLETHFSVSTDTVRGWLSIYQWKNEVAA